MAKISLGFKLNCFSLSGIAQMFVSSWSDKADNKTVITVSAVTGTQDEVYFPCWFENSVLTVLSEVTVQFQTL